MIITEAQNSTDANILGWILLVEGMLLLLVLLLYENWAGWKKAALGATEAVEVIGEW